MKLVNSSIFIAVVSAIAAVAVNNYPLSSQQQITANVEVNEKLTKSYILQGASPAHLNQLVNGVGGAVSREFPIINAVSALLTPSQADRIREAGGVRIQNDRTVITSNNNSNNNNNNNNSYVQNMNALSETINNHIAEQTGANRLHDLNITGKGVTVAIVDSGANMHGKTGTHLYKDTSGKKRVSIKYDAFRGKTFKKYNDDQNGHGTHVAGLIGSSIRANDGKFNGIAPDVYMLSVKAFDQNGESSYSTVLDALNWIFENRYKYKIRVINLSLGAAVQSNYWNDPINQAVMRLWDAGVVVVSSAGNNGEDMGITVPGNTPYIITVGAATDSLTPNDMTDDRLASFSAKGPTYEGFVKPEVIAYGSRIASKLDPKYLRKLLRASVFGEDYSEVSGTSQAAAIVTGVVALMISNDPDISPNDVKCRLIQTAIPANNGTTATYSPFEQGAGLVNAYRAVMSNATNCANIGLDIKSDLLGTNHFMGPAKQNVLGEYFIELADGTIFTEGMHWGTADMNLNGMHWGSASLGLEGMHWGGVGMNVKGMHWSNSDVIVKGLYWGGANVNTEAMHWGGAEMGVQGMYWSDANMSLKGMHWGGSRIDVNGIYWGDHPTSLESIDLEVPPIDPNAELIIVEETWL